MRLHLGLTRVHGFTSHCRAFTIRELIAVLTICVVLIATVAVILPPRRREARKAQDADNLRAIQRALVTCTGFGDYPLPSFFDTNNQTVPEPGREKNTSSNIYSCMIALGVVHPAQLVSPLETNPNIVVDNDYAFTSPPSAVNPTNALWDPAFNADFSDPNRQGNLSYAHMLPADRRRVFWSNTYSPFEPVLANRGPRVTAVTYLRGGGTDTITSPSSSNSYRFHLPTDRWTGNVTFNDGHVAFQTSMTVPHMGYTPRGGPGAPTVDSDDKRADVLFYNEPDDIDDMNFYLSIFTKVGEISADCVSIWD